MKWLYDVGMSSVFRYPVAPQHVMLVIYIYILCVPWIGSFGSAAMAQRQWRSGGQPGRCMYVMCNVHHLPHEVAKSNALLWREEKKKPPITHIYEMHAPARTTHTI